MTTYYEPTVQLRNGHEAAPGTMSDARLRFLLGRELGTPLCVVMEALRRGWDVPDDLPVYSLRRRRPAPLHKILGGRT